MRVGNLAFKAVGFGALTTLLAGTAIALASTPSTGYTACANHKHVLSVQSHGKCPSGTAKVAVGKQGARGKAGAAGKTGPSDTYISDFWNNGGPDSGTGPTLDGQPSASWFTLPAGAYAVHYDVTIENPPTDAATSISCRSTYSTGSTNRLGAPMEVSVPAGGAATPSFGSGSLSEPLSVTASTTVTTTCTNAGTSGAVYEWDITATRTGALHASGHEPVSVV